MVLLVLFQMYQAAFGTMAASINGLAIGVMCVVTANVLFAFGPRALGTLGAAFYFLFIALPMPSFLQGLIVSNLQNFVAIHQHARSRAIRRRGCRVAGGGGVAGAPR